MAGRILVVDDDPRWAEGLRSELTHAGVDVRDASDVASALDALQTESYCALVLDLVLENGSGFDVLREMERNSWKVPTIVVSEKLPSYVREMLHDEQVKLVFPKSVDLKLLASVVSGLCRA